MQYLRGYLVKHKKKKISNVISVIKYFLIICTLLVVFSLSILLLYFVIDDSDHKNHIENIQELFIEKEAINSNINAAYDFSTWNKTCDWNLLVVNDQNQLPQDFGVKLGKYKDKEIDYRIIDSLMTMLEDAYEDNIILWISSGYRDLKLQSQLFWEEVASFKDNGYSNFEADKLAARNVARPRKSEHNLGLAIDFNGVRDDFVDTKEYKWLMDNSINYGFILRYPENKKEITGVQFEPWHFRYVGEAAIKIKENDLCLEEYIITIM